jgi:hypothetical protein
MEKGRRNPVLAKGCCSSADFPYFLPVGGVKDFCEACFEDVIRRGG